MAAAELAEQSRSATSPALATILAAMADDEERHATLAWRIVAWARISGGDTVARALADTMRGLAPEEEGTSLRATILREVISPCATMLS